eukprot:COSAG02_NODE_8982_length_2373_cov_5.550572_1_plen_105_part_10
MYLSYTNYSCKISQYMYSCTGTCMWRRRRYGTRSPVDISEFLLAENGQDQSARVLAAAQACWVWLLAGDRSFRPRANEVGRPGRAEVALKEVEQRLTSHRASNTV